MVGDNPETDIIGGKSIGAVTFQKINAAFSDKGEGKYEPDYVFNHFKDFHSLVKNI